MNAALQPDVAPADWARDAEALSAVRRRVFIEEQGVPEALEWDGLDHGAQHLLARVGAQPVGCARLLPGGRIGRMAVLSPWRGQGIGSALLRAALDLARRQGLAEVTLSAQVAAIPFYRKAGFVVCSGPYLDAGIQHRDMRRALSVP